MGSMKRIDSTEALSPGCELWVLPPREKSQWAERIDWYLGFQIERARPHKPAQFSPDLQEVIERWEFEIPAVRLASDDPSKTPLMIASSRLLPNRMTVVLPSSTDAEWIAEAHRVWTGLGRPKVRAFLPSSVSPGAFETRWPKEDRDAEVEFISDLDA
jgi:hypothetical protein